MLVPKLWLSPPSIDPWQVCSRTSLFDLDHKVCSDVDNDFTLLKTKFDPDGFKTKAAETIVNEETGL